MEISSVLSSKHAKGMPCVAKRKLVFGECFVILDPPVSVLTGCGWSCPISRSVNPYIPVSFFERLVLLGMLESLPLDPYSYFRYPLDDCRVVPIDGKYLLNNGFRVGIVAQTMPDESSACDQHSTAIASQVKSSGFRKNIRRKAEMKHVLNRYR